MGLDVLRVVEGERLLEHVARVARRARRLEAEDRVADARDRGLDGVVDGLGVVGLLARPAAGQLAERVAEERPHDLERLREVALVPLADGRARRRRVLERVDAELDAADAAPQLLHLVPRLVGVAVEAVAERAVRGLAWAASDSTSLQRECSARARPEKASTLRGRSER